MNTSGLRTTGPVHLSKQTLLKTIAQNFPVYQRESRPLDTPAAGIPEPRRTAASRPARGFGAAAQAAKKN